MLYQNDIILLLYLSDYDQNITSCQCLYKQDFTTHPVAVVTDLYDGFILSQVPDNSFPTGAGRGQDVLHLPVP